MPFFNMTAHLKKLNGIASNEWVCNLEHSNEANITFN